MRTGDRAGFGSLVLSTYDRIVLETDIVIVGAGLSGIGAAYHLSTMCPERSFVMLEGREEIGGTWSLFKSPGVRSDSDMHTLGFGFRPWVHDKAIADGGAILDYLRETVEEFDLAKYIRFHHNVERAEWSSDTATWTLTVLRKDTDETVTYKCNFLYMCSGYYSYRAGYTPDFVGRDDFDGAIVHPQEWPSDFDYTDKRVVVIGSGATAVTLVPAMAKDAASVTMLQRSATYVVAQPDKDALANTLRRWLPDRIAYAITRRKNIARDQWLYKKTRRSPQQVRAVLLRRVANAIGRELTDEHFSPAYDPWDQRLCLVPNGDFFDAINEGSAAVVTDTITRFTRDGVLLDSGRLLEADIIVTATGLQLVTLGEMDITVDGTAVDFAETWTYRGVSYSGIPNLVSTFGYINASWTLRSDMVSQYTCRLLQHMAQVGANVCVPLLRPEDESMTPGPWIDNFSSGYVQRMLPLLPKQGDHDPWRNPQLYAPDRKSLTRDAIDDGVMRFHRVVSS